jgi:trehalose 6-phosphate phosphatase
MIFNNSGRFAVLPPAFARDWCFFLDVDGTLVEIAARPDAVRVDASLRDQLADLAHATQGALALVSGRGLADLDRLFAPLALYSAGQHGAERRGAGGALHVHPCRSDALRGAAGRLAAFARARPGLVFEDKGVTLAMHYRLAPGYADAVRAAVADALLPLGSGFALQEGKMVAEIKPATVDKGTAIAAFMREAPFAGRVPVFIGDDATDEPGFAAVNALGGVSLKVGGGKSQARWALADATSVRTWLAAWMVACGTRAAA